jgi:hypothetical protein
MTTLTQPATVITHRSSRLTWAILGLVLLADALDVIDATVTNIAAPTIAGELHGGESLIKWLDRHCGWVLVLVEHSGTNVSLWALAPAFFVIGVGIGLSFATIPVVALGDARPDEAGSASGSFSSIQQLASAIGSAAVTSIFFQAGTSGLGHAMKVTLIVVLALTAFSLPVVALMPRKAPAEPRE